MEGLWEVTNALSNSTIPDPRRYPPFLDWGFATPAQNSNRYYPIGMGKAITDFKFGQYIRWVYPNKRPLKIWTKGSVGVSKDFPNFWVPPYYLRNG